MNKSKLSGKQTSLFGPAVEPAEEVVVRGGVTSLKDLMGKYKPKEKNKYISSEHQDFGYKLAAELDDLAHKSLYIRLAKQENRGILEKARSFVSDAASAKSKARLFMWKLKQLRDEQKEVKDLSK